MLTKGSQTQQVTTKGSQTQQVTTFTYTEDNPEVVTQFSGVPLLELECKHVLSPKTRQRQIYEDKIKYVVENSIKAGYPGVVWGYASGTVDNSKEIESLLTMQVNRSYNRPIKVVRTSDGVVWSDNTHSTIAYILRYQLKLDKVRLKDVPYYVIDFYDREVPMIASINDSVLGSIPDILQALRAAYKIELRVQRGLDRTQPNQWTIENFMQTMILPEWIAGLPEDMQEGERT